VKSVVVVDDDDGMRELIVLLLRGRYDVASAQDGAAGLELVKSVRPDLVVLDLLMPGLHGFEVCRRIRDDQSLKGTKVLITSSKSYPSDQRTALEEAGADSYLVKPFEIDALQQRVKQLLGEA
jgi:DNA-binding response OmpR family regulator